MAIPTITNEGRAQTKTAATSLAISGLTLNLNVGDYILLNWTRNPGAGTKDNAPTTTGTAVFDPWYVGNGQSAASSGTTGAYIGWSYAKVTAAGTLTSITANFVESTAASVVQVSRVTGAVGASAQQPSGQVSTSGSPYTTTATGSTTADRSIFCFGAFEAAAGGTASALVAETSGWTIGTRDTVTYGTTGGGGASNLCILHSTASHITHAGGQATAGGYWTGFEPFVSLTLSWDGASPPATAPTGLTAVTASSTQIDVSWTAHPDATEYVLDWSTDDITWNSINVGNVTSYAHTALAASTTYYYRVAARNVAGPGPYSASIFESTYGAVTLELYEGGILRANLGTFEVTSNTGQIGSFTWDADILSTMTGIDVELRITSNASIDIGAVEWNLQKYAAATPEPTTPQFAAFGVPL